MRRPYSVTGLVVILALAGCAWFGGRAKPAWVDGVSPDFPPGRFLVGVGQAESRTMSEDQAYTAVARVFKAEVSAQSKDWESYLLVEQRGQALAERRLTLDSLTRVSTDKVLENVRIVDRWFDPRTRVHYSLAAMDRAQAEASFVERITELDHSVRAEVDEAQRATEKLMKVRALRRAIRNLVLRETYNADLRVIRATGQGMPAPYRVQELTQELEHVLVTHLVFGVLVTGDHAEPVQRALEEGLIREGLQVISRSAGTEPPAGATDGPSPALLIRGHVQVWPVDIRDPHFIYVRWCSDFEVVDVGGRRVLGAISRGGKEGHLSEREATARVVRVMQQEFMSEVAKTVAAHVYGESELPAEAVRPAGCPRDGTAPEPATATH